MYLPVHNLLGTRMNEPSCACTGVMSFPGCPIKTVNDPTPERNCKIISALAEDLVDIATFEPRKVSDSKL